jgi:hypothetical protein
LVAIALTTVGAFVLPVIAIEQVGEVQIIHETQIVYKPVQGTNRVKKL